MTLVPLPAWLRIVGALGLRPVTLAACLTAASVAVSAQQPDLPYHVGADTRSAPWASEMLMNSPARPLLAYRCPEDVIHQRALCTALQAALGSAMPGHALRRLLPGTDVPPLSPKDAIVILRVDRSDQFGIAGYLEVRHGGKCGMRAGPRVALDVQDAPLAPGMMADFVTSIMRASQPLISPTPPGQPSGHAH